jgi:hypothetical protein
MKNENALTGKTISCWSGGCFCEIHPEWMPHNKWNHGFAIIDLYPDDNFRVTNLKILNGQVY